MPFRDRCKLFRTKNHSPLRNAKTRVKVTQEYLSFVTSDSIVFGIKKPCLGARLGFKAGMGNFIRPGAAFKKFLSLQATFSLRQCIDIK
jgi:hypothetical protein